MNTSTTKKEAWELYQQLCDEVFGTGAITIKKEPSNNVIGTLCYVDDYLEFKKNFKQRLVRLKKRFEGTDYYPDLLEQVKQVADKKNWNGAYAELVAYDIMWNDSVLTHLELNVTLPAEESYAEEMGYKATNEDGYLKDYGLYFDVKILEDTVSTILKGIIDEAIKNSKQTGACNILPKYPYDDDYKDYSGSNRKALCDELTAFLNINNTKKTGTKVFKSNILKQLSYRVHWGGGVNSVMSEYNPYRQAEENKNLVFKRYTKKIMKNDTFMLVLVNFPWYNNRNTSFYDCDNVYYRSLARRTFCGYKNLGTKMNKIVEKYNSTETVYEVSKHLAGIIFINDNSIKEDSYTCNVFLNPNACNYKEQVKDYLYSLVQNGDDRSSIDNFQYDNY